MKNGVFEILSEFLPKYLFEGPMVRFITAILHPNLDNNLIIKNLLFNKAWLPKYTIEMISLQSFQKIRNPDYNEL